MEEAILDCFGPGFFSCGCKGWDVDECLVVCRVVVYVFRARREQEEVVTS